MKNIYQFVLAIGFSFMLCSWAAANDIPGYTYGQSSVKTAPYTLEDLELLKITVLFTAEDAKWLRESRKVLEPHAEELLDTWYGFVGANPHLLYFFQSKKDGTPNGEYLARVRARFCLLYTSPSPRDS